MICRQHPPHTKLILLAACVLAFTTLVGIASAAEVTATRLDGGVVTGALREWDNEHILIATPAGERRIATDQLVSLRRAAAPGLPISEKGVGHVELIDGSTLPIQ